MAGALPDGTLKDHVARVAGIRALLVVDERRRLVHGVELRNADRKIVVRLDVDEPADGGVVPPPVVTVRPLRGYQKEADRAWRLVVTLLEPALDGPVAPRPVSPSVVDPESPARALLAATSEHDRETADMRVAEAVISAAEGEPERTLEILAPVLAGAAPALHRAATAIETWCSFPHRRTVPIRRAP